MLATSVFHAKGGPQSGRYTFAILIDTDTCLHPRLLTLLFGLENFSAGKEHGKLMDRKACAQKISKLLSHAHTLHTLHGVAHDVRLRDLRQYLCNRIITYIYETNAIL